jgi:carbon monoxide dehydrogenase subunit G
MRVEREFTVGAPLERAWPALSDIGVIAGCIPGAELRQVDDVFTGRVELAANGSRMLCDATMRAVDLDDDEHVVTALIHARQVDGPAIGSATVRSRCEARDGSTHVVLTAEILSSGYQAPAGTVASGAGELLSKAAELLRQRALESPRATPSPPSAEPSPAPAASSESPPTPGASTGPPPGPAASPPPDSAPSGRLRERQRRAALAGGALLAVVVARRLFGTRRKGLW